MHILGINAYHGGASATIIRDGQLLAAVEEERFTRQKYWAGFPTQSIQYCLSIAGISAQDLDHIGISRNPSANLLKKAVFTLTNRPSLSFLQDRMKNAGKVGDLKGEFARQLGIDPASLRAEFHNVEHHRAHIASAFFVSPFDDAAILSVDGMGDFVSTMSAVGHDNNLRVLDTVHFPHSLGNFYTAITQWLGFPYYGDEGKVMGLAPYGRPRYMDKLAKVLRWKSNGDFELNLDYFATFADGNLMRWDGGSPTMPILFSNELVNLMGAPRQPNEEITPYHEDVASSLQAVLEEVELAIVKTLHKKTGRKVLCMAGGVALNSAFNGKILSKTGFDEIFIQPAAGDAGTSLGVCYYIYHQVLGKPRNFVMQSSYTGPQFSKAECKAALEKNNLAYWVLDEKSLFEVTAEKVADAKVVGWFQGQMEWGPRALGNRSILADPRYAQTKEILNLKIKKREKFRPFAPAILAQATGEYFDQTYPDPFMLKVYNVLPEKHTVIPAVTHVDGTGRLQTVEEHVNPRYYGIINAFAERTGVPVLLNTSFNENEPIVCTPQQAIDCFLRTKMDVLVLGDYLVERS